MPPSRPRDGREFVRVFATLPDDPKLLDTTDIPRCGWLYVVGLLYARKHRTDGVLRADVVVRDAGVPKRLTGELVRAGMWHEPGHTCDRCVQPPARYVVVHDYLQHQQSRDEIEAARDAGRKAAEARWSGRAERNGKPPERTAIRSADRSAEPYADRNTEAEAEAEAEAEGKSLLLTCVSRLAGSDARAGDRLPAELLAAWRETAAPGVDLVAEARAYLAHYADRPATNERAAWLGWLKRARPASTSSGPRAACTDPECHGGWLPQLPDDDRPRPCPTCKPHIRTA